VSPRVWRAGPEEAPHVARLIAEFRATYGKSSPTEAEMLAVAEQLIQRDDTEYLLGGDGPDGVVQLRYRLSMWTAAEDCWIEDVYIAERARRTGLGRALVLEALDRARARGCKRAELDVDATNAPARALYALLGFRDKAEGGSMFLQHDLD
jgi:ribosomal protein S18 acetylase RimI-like enzyme